MLRGIKRIFKRLQKLHRNGWNKRTSDHRVVDRVVAQALRATRDMAARPGRLSRGHALDPEPEQSISSANHREEIEEELDRIFHDKPRRFGRRQIVVLSCPGGSC